MFLRQLPCLVQKYTPIILVETLGSVLEKWDKTVDMKRRIFVLQQACTISHQVYPQDSTTNLVAWWKDILHRTWQGYQSEVFTFTAVRSTRKWAAKWDNPTGLQCLGRRCKRYDHRYAVHHAAMFKKTGLEYHKKKAAALHKKKDAALKRERGLQCVATFKTSISRCNTCCCAKGLLKASVESSLSFGAHDRCGSWFTMQDFQIRTYMAAFRMVMIIKWFTRSCFYTKPDPPKCRKDNKKCASLTE